MNFESTRSAVVQTVISTLCALACLAILARAPGRYGTARAPALPADGPDRPLAHERYFNERVGTKLLHQAINPLHEVLSFSWRGRRSRI
jgi:hypothetical protein